MMGCHLYVRVYILTSTLNHQLRDMTAFIILYCIVTHIKITIHSLYCKALPYCNDNTDSPFLFYYFFYNPPLWKY